MSCCFDISVPLPPSIVRADNATETTFELLWTEAYGEKRYNVSTFCGSFLVLGIIRLMITFKKKVAKQNDSLG